MDQLDSNLSPLSPTPRGTADSSGGGVREFVLVKNEQRYVFRCSAGEESQLLSQIAQLVHEPANGLTWFDAATLSEQITKVIGSKLTP